MFIQNESRNTRFSLKSDTNVAQCQTITKTSTLAKAKKLLALKFWQDRAWTSSLLDSNLLGRSTNSVLP